MLQNRLSLVTGSTSGVGLSIARTLAKHGSDIVFHGFGEESEISALRADTEREHGVRTFYKAADLTQRGEQIRQIAIDIKKEAKQHIDILVNNAGFQHISPLHNFEVAEFDALLAVLLSAPFHLSSSVLADMRRAGYGRIVNIGSVHSLVASVNKSAYVASKHGLAGLTKAIALENAAAGNLTCNLIAPGWTETPLIARQMELRVESGEASSLEAARELLLAEKQPSKQFVNVREIAQLAAHLCDPATKSINGACIPIDGGWTAQ